MGIRDSVDHYGEKNSYDSVEERERDKRERETWRDAGVWVKIQSIIEMTLVSREMNSIYQRDREKARETEIEIEVEIETKLGLGLMLRAHQQPLRPPRRWSMQCEEILVGQ